MAKEIAKSLLDIEAVTLSRMTYIRGVQASNLPSTVITA